MEYLALLWAGCGFFSDLQILFRFPINSDHCCLQVVSRQKAKQTARTNMHNQICLKCPNCEMAFTQVVL